MHGVVIFDKPKGITSQDAVTLVKRMLGAKKAGHAGTLDPIATGVLLVCVGEATKASSLFMDLPKQYRATIKLGERTDTFDAEGRVVETREYGDITLPKIEQELDRFRGVILQRPPMYSAVKVGGQPLYKLARKGKDVERKEREVTVYSLKVEEVMLPYVTLLISCSKGFYVRALADDLGRALGTVAHLSGLVRTAVGEFRVEAAVSSQDSSTLHDAVIPLDAALSHIKEVILNPEDHRIASHGGAVDAFGYGTFKIGEPLRLKDPDGNLFALGEAAGRELRVRRGLNLPPKS